MLMGLNALNLSCRRLDTILRTLAAGVGASIPPASVVDTVFRYRGQATPRKERKVHFPNLQQVQGSLSCRVYFWHAPALKALPNQKPGILGLFQAAAGAGGAAGRCTLARRAQAGFAEPRMV
jgi:hypothetical protein